jgi:hypothetical protein
MCSLDCPRPISSMATGTSPFTGYLLLSRYFMFMGSAFNSRMANPKTLATLGTQCTGPRQNATQNKTQHIKLKRLTTLIPSNTGGEPWCSRRISSSCLLLDTRLVTHVVKTCFYKTISKQIQIT